MYKSIIYVSFFTHFTAAVTTKAKVVLMLSLIFMCLDCGILPQFYILTLKSMVIKQERLQWQEHPIFTVTLQLFLFLCVLAWTVLFSILLLPLFPTSSSFLPLKFSYFLLSSVVWSCISEIPVSIFSSTFFYFSSTPRLLVPFVSLHSP